MKRDAVIVVAVFALSLWHNLSHVGSNPFNHDEARWLNRAHYIRDVLHPFGPTWQDGYLTRTQPPVGSYVTGLGLLLQGRSFPKIGVWNFTYDDRGEWQRNIAAGNMPSRADIDAGRRTSAELGAITAVVLYVLGKRLTNRLGGAVAGLFLALHPFHAYVSSLATSDTVFGLLLALAALAAWRLAAKPSWPRALLFGALLGLGGATKLSPLVTSVPLAAFGGALLVVPRLLARIRRSVDGRPDDALGWRLVALPAIAFATFVAVYPYLWPDPVGRTRHLFEFRVQEMRDQGAKYAGLRVENRGQAFYAVGYTLSTHFSVAGQIRDALDARLGVAWPPVGADLALALIGAELLVMLAARRGLWSGEALVAAFLFAQLAVTMAGMRSFFDRYAVPVVLTESLCVGVLVAQVAGGLRALAARRGLLTRPAPMGEPELAVAPAGAD